MRIIGGIVLFILLFLFLVWPGWFREQSIRQLPWAQVLSPTAPAATPTVVPTAQPTRVAEPTKATGAPTVTVASLTKVTTTVWVQECKLDSGKPECDWVLKEARTETKVGEPRVSVGAATVTATPTVTATVTPTATVTSTPTPTATATPAPTATPRPAVTAPAPQAVPAAPEPERPYDQTGVGKTRQWTLSVPPEWVLIVGGYRVDGRKEEGVYKAYGGGQTVTVTVTDGFYRMVRAEAGPSEFCNRVRQARQMSWALSVMEPLPGWPAC